MTAQTLKRVLPVVLEGGWVGKLGLCVLRGGSGLGRGNFPDASSANLFQRWAQELCVHRPKSTVHIHTHPGKAVFYNRLVVKTFLQLRSFL